VAIGVQNHSKLTLLNVFTDKQYNEVLDAEDYQTQFQERLEAARTKLNEVASRIAADCRPGALVHCGAKVMAGRVVDVVAGLLENEHFDLIVQGTTGASNLSDRYVGSMSVKVIERINCTILSIPDGATFHGINRIVYATDYLEEDKIAMQQIVALAVVANAEVRVLHISHSDNILEQAVHESYIEEMKNFVHYDRLSFERVVFHHATEGIHHYMKESDSDLLILLDKKRSYFQKIFKDSLNVSLPQVADYPFMIVKLR
jgi:nucleotide-binding universal stress UspA family protein